MVSALFSELMWRHEMLSCVMFVLWEVTAKFLVLVLSHNQA